MPSSRRTSKRRLLRPSTIIGGLFLLLVVLVLLAIPFAKAPGHAQGAKADLEAAKTALANGDIAAAEASVQSARRHADQVQGAMQGIGGDIWSLIPVVGRPVADVRHLGNALDEVTAVAEAGVRVLPQVRGKDSTLLNEGNVDLDVLTEVATELDDVSDRLDRARSELDDVADQAPLAGSRLGDARDDVLAQIEPLTKGLAVVNPLLDQLPTILGASAGRQYLVALLNPAEQRYSGGTPLTFVTVDFDGGQMSVSEPIDTATARGVGQPFYWIKVKGNPFHRGRLNVLTATSAPDWSVSGNELANAWRSLRGRRLSGVVVADVVTLADLVALTGPIEVPTVGTLTGDNLVEKLVGSYDQYPDPAQRKTTNRAIAPVFTERLLTSTDPEGVGRVLARAADERRFAIFLRDPDEQAAFDELGLTGTLGAADRDYLGVFSQNLVPSKTDYWQRRSVRSDVQVRADGSAHVRLTVGIHNDSPPYLRPGTDPREGYFTRWARVSVLTMLPEEATFASASGTLDGRPFPIQRGNFYGRTFQRTAVGLPPQARREMVVEYDIPSVATVGDDGSLDYGLVLDPQGMVDAESVTVRVQFPEGYSVTDHPAEWTTKGRVATYRTDGLETSEVFEVGAHP